MFRPAYIILLPMIFKESICVISPNKWLIEIFIALIMCQDVKRLECCWPLNMIFSKIILRSRYLEWLCCTCIYTLQWCAISLIFVLFLRFVNKNVYDQTYCLYFIFAYWAWLKHNKLYSQRRVCLASAIRRLRIKAIHSIIKLQSV